MGRGRGVDCWRVRQVRKGCGCRGLTEEFEDWYRGIFVAMAGGARVIATWKQEQKGRDQEGKPKEVDRSSRQSPRTKWRRDEPLDPGLCAVLWTGILG